MSILSILYFDSEWVTHTDLPLLLEQIAEHEKTAAAAKREAVRLRAKLIKAIAASPGE